MWSRALRLKRLYSYKIAFFTQITKTEYLILLLELKAIGNTAKDAL